MERRDFVRMGVAGTVSGAVFDGAACASTLVPATVPDTVPATPIRTKSLRSMPVYSVKWSSNSIAAT